MRMLEMRSVAHPGDGLQLDVPHQPIEDAIPVGWIKRVFRIAGTVLLAVAGLGVLVLLILMASIPAAP